MTFINTFFKTLFILLLSAFLTSCQSETKKTPRPKAQPIPAGVIVPCRSPRPKVCTEEYMPVCASKDTGIRCFKAPCPSTKGKTYPNSCKACMDPKVDSFVPGGQCK